MKPEEFDRLANKARLLPWSNVRCACFHVLVKGSTRKEACEKFGVDKGNLSNALKKIREAQNEH